MSLHSISDLEQTPVPDLVDVIELIDQHLMARNTAPYTRQLGCFHPSEIGSSSGKSPDGQYPMGCGMMLWFGLMEQVPKVSHSPRLYRIFDLGTHIHDMLQQYFVKMAEDVGIKVEIEVKTPRTVLEDGREIPDNEWLILGSCDAVLTSPEIRQGLEFKSMNDRNFQASRRPKPEHVIQATCYQALLDLPLMSYVYLNKNDSSLLSRTLHFDTGPWDQIRQKLEHILDLASNGKSPDREVGSHCSECGHVERCRPPNVVSSTSLVRRL